LAWGEGAGQATSDIWQQFVALAHGPAMRAEADLFAEPSIAQASDSGVIPSRAPKESLEELLERFAKIGF
jgi:hypothetical protein